MPQQPTKRNRDPVKSVPEQHVILLSPSSSSLDSLSKQGRPKRNFAHNGVVLFFVWLSGYMLRETAVELFPQESSTLKSAVSPANEDSFWLQNMTATEGGGEAKETEQIVAEEDDDAATKEEETLFIGMREIRDGNTTELLRKPKIRVKRQLDPGLKDLMERSKNLPPEPFNISAAVCHKTIFGIMDLWTFIDWAVYHHMLGFDHIFVSYLPDIKDKDGFKELVSLPYVTAWENKKGYVEKVDRDFDEKLRERVYTQGKLEEMCLTDFAAGYDWVMNADADEYLWLNESMGVKQFLSKVEEQHYDYMVLGKWLYSPGFRDREEFGNDSGFYLADYPFTGGPYCGKKKLMPVDDVCFTASRPKTIVKPRNHTMVKIHGSHDASKRDASLPMPGTWGHFKEWPSVNIPVASQPDVRPPKNFYVKTIGAARMVKAGKYILDPAVGAEIRYDANISKWFEYVAHRR